MCQVSHRKDQIDEKIPAYNFDIAEGVTYDLDISKPIGQRMQNLFSWSTS